MAFRLMAFRLYVDDWEGGTAHMTNEESGAYMRLLLYQFRNGSIPENIFCRICGSTTVQQMLQPKFNKCGENGNEFYQTRMQEVRQDAINYHEAQSNKGKKSAETRSNRGSTVVEPSGRGRGIGSGSTEKDIGGMGEKGKTFFEKSVNDEGWQESVMRTCKINNPVHWINEFNAHATATEEHYNTITDWRRHCVNWIKKEKQQQEKQKKNGTGKQTADERLQAYRDYIANG